MDLQALLAALEGMENGEEMGNFVKSLAGDISKKNNEAKNLRTRAKTAEDNITALGDKLSKLATVIGLDLEDEELDLDSALEAYKQKLTQPPGPDGKGQPSPEIAQLTSQLNQMQRDLKKLSTEKETFAQTATQEKEKRINLMRNSLLMQELVKAKVLDPDILVPALQSKLKFVEDAGSEQFLFAADDGNDLTIEEGVKSFLDAHPTQLANAQRPGSGSGGAGGGNIDLDKMSPEEYRAARAKL